MNAERNCNPSGIAQPGIRLSAARLTQTNARSTMRLPSKALLVLVAALAAACAAPAASTRTTTPSPGEPTLAEVRAATERFRDVRAALAEGYIRDPSDMCVTASMMGRPGKRGGMGIHYFRPDLLGFTKPPSPRTDGDGTHTDFRTPGILIYEPQADGSLELVAVENLVFARAWRAKGHYAPPTFHGAPYESMADDPATPIDEGHNFEPHYDHHVWIYRENPDGVFAPFNPAVTCEHHASAHARHAHRAHGRQS
jgi:hypothetical protein